MLNLPLFLNFLITVENSILHHQYLILHFTCVRACKIKKNLNQKNHVNIILNDKIKKKIISEIKNITEMNIVIYKKTKSGID